MMLFQEYFSKGSPEDVNDVNDVNELIIVNGLIVSTHRLIAF